MTFIPRSLALIVLVLALAGCDEGNPFGVDLDDGGTDTAENVAADVTLFVELVNLHRASTGCPTLSWRPDVAEVAQQHSEDMVRRDYFDHVNPDGQSPFDRLQDADISFQRAGENIAAGQPTAEIVLNAWLESDGHRANIENCAYTHHGMGLHERHWTHVFMTPR